MNYLLVHSLFDEKDDVIHNETMHTTEEPGREINSTLVLVYDILIVFQVSIMMFAMGAGADFQEIKSHLLRPKATIIGLVCQLFIMPFLCFALAHMLALDDSIAVGIMIVASCPSGAPSTFFTAVSRGDLSLSVCITIASSILALGTMPLNKFMYVGSFSDQSFVIPFINILIGIVATWIPAVLGMLIRFNSVKMGEAVSKIGGIIAFLVLIVFAVIQNLVYPGLFGLPLNVWFAALFIPVLGWLVGFALATVFMLDIAQRRAVAYGTSYVNAGLILALISLTYGGQTIETNDLIVYPMLHMACQLTEAIIFMVIHLLYFAVKEERTCCQKCYQKHINKTKPHGTFQEISIGVGAPPLDSHIRRYQEILTKLYGISENESGTSTPTRDSPPPSYCSLHQGNGYVEIDLNPEKSLAARKRSSTFQANESEHNALNHTKSIRLNMNPDIDTDTVTHEHSSKIHDARRRSSLPTLLEIGMDHFQHVDLSDESSGYEEERHSRTSSDENTGIYGETINL